jgi:hypothetical protein
MSWKLGEGYSVSETYHGNYKLEVDKRRRDYSVVFSEIYVTANGTLEFDTLGEVVCDIEEEHLDKDTNIYFGYVPDTPSRPDASGNPTIELSFPESARVRLANLVKQGEIPGEIE